MFAEGISFVIEAFGQLLQTLQSLATNMVFDSLRIDRSHAVADSDSLEEIIDDLMAAAGLSGQALSFSSKLNWAVWLRVD